MEYEFFLEILAQEGEKYSTIFNSQGSTYISAKYTY